jgi:RNase adaptor protein for sRNA GlmZ degradation
VSLTVRLYSFGYHRSGIPEDPAGNGGGFVFDCRGLPNPGRKPRFMRLSGLDAEVRSYLADEGDVARFLASVIHLLETVVDAYQRSGYEDLHVCFGCTGGQHRSVYCAEEVAARLRSAGVRVEVRHTEQGVWW